MEGEKKQNFVVKYFSDFKVLRETKREYWGLQVINALDCLAYFALFNVIIISLSDDYGFSDVNAGYVFTAFTSTATICLFFAGLITDWLGIKKSLYYGIAGLLLTRFGMVAAAFMPESTGRDVLVIASLFMMAPFMSMLQTVFQAANKRFTTKKSRGAGFNLWYLFMNVGAAGGGFLVDIMYKWAGLPRFHIFTFGIFTAVLCVLATFWFIRNTDQIYSSEEERLEEEKADAEKEGQEKKTPFQIAGMVMKESVFWRFTLLITLLLGVRSVFLYLGLLYPKFWLRVIGPDADIGTLQAINPVLVIFGLVLLIPILSRFNVYKMLVFGAFITSISMFISAVPPMFGFQVGQWTYITTIAFLLVLTVGELIWSPRLQEYTAAIAPKGQEGTYLGLSMVPYFLAKTFVAIISGHMLTKWCPAPPKDNPLQLQQQMDSGQIAYTESPYMMWIVLGSLAMVGTIVAIIMKKWFTEGSSLDDSKKEDAATA